MRRAAAVATAAAVAGTGALAGCGGQDDGTGLAGRTWQIVAIYTTPGNTGDLPADAAGRATLTLGSGTMKGQTGCVRFTAEVTSQDASLHLDRVEMADPGDCSGGSRHVHDQLAGLITGGADFDVRRLGDSEAVLTRRGETIDAPAIRIMAQ